MTKVHFQYPQAPDPDRISSADLSRVLVLLLELEAHGKARVSSATAKALLAAKLITASHEGGEVLGALTPRGRTFLQLVRAGLCLEDAEALYPACMSPMWESSRRELWYGSVLVKRMWKTSPNQQCILDAFEQQGWPKRILDPLPFIGGSESPTRLHDAINRLNARMLMPMIRFSGDGSGTGVTWRVVQTKPKSKGRKKFSRK